MATNTLVCAICDSLHKQHNTPPSVYWCPECDEALCADCSEHHSISKGTRGHRIITVSQYLSLPNFVSEIHSFCNDHNEKFEQFCRKHDCPICPKCIREHGKCNQVVPLEEVVDDFKDTERFQDLEQSLKDILEKINQLREDKENNAKSFKLKKKKFITEIESIKMQISQHLDKLKDDFIKQLDKVYSEHYDIMQSIICSLKDQEKEINHCIIDVENMKKYASNLQTFLGMTDIQLKVTNNDKRLNSVIQNECSKNVDMLLMIDNDIQSILTSVSTFGSIELKENPSPHFLIPSKKIKQAQITTPNRIRSINNILVARTQSLDTACYSSSGCSVTQKGDFLFTEYCNYNDKTLILLNAQGGNERPIQLFNSAFDVECLNDNTIAVTAGKLKWISIVDLNTGKETERIDLPGYPFGITHDSKSLICCVECKDIHLISLSDYSISTIPNTILPKFSYVATYGNKIFFTNPEEHKVFCIFKDGTREWSFYDETVLQTPRGITVDDRGNIFVVGCDSFNVIVLSQDGRQSKQMVKCQNKPFATFFDSLGKNLLLTYEFLSAELYRVSYL